MTASCALLAGSARWGLLELAVMERNFADRFVWQSSERRLVIDSRLCFGQRCLGLFGGIKSSICERL